MNNDPKKELDLIKDEVDSSEIIGEVIQVTDSLVEDENLEEDNENKTPLQYIKE